MTATTLRAALAQCDLLLIDDLHAWQFTLGEGEPALCIECMDGRDRRLWRFTAEALEQARYDAGTDTWHLAGEAGEHRLQCLGAICADNEDDDPEPGHDEQAE